MKNFLLITLALVAITQSLAVNSANDYYYSRQTKWGELEDSSACSTGNMQSPVNMLPSNFSLSYDNYNRHRPKLSPTCKVRNYKLINNNHTIEVHPPQGEYFEGCTMIFSENDVCHLSNIHVHSQSEHLVDGKAFEMEVHLVHTCSDGLIAVYGIFFTINNKKTVVRNTRTGIRWINRVFGDNFNRYPDTHETDFINQTVDLYQLIDRKSQIMTYKGSLTTPPCLEIVTFYLQTKVQHVSLDQLLGFQSYIRQFSEDHYEVNNRAVQNLNGRTISVV
eukprot:Awhi_evm1s10283